MHVCDPPAIEVFETYSCSKSVDIDQVRKQCNGSTAVEILKGKSMKLACDSPNTFQFLLLEFLSAPRVLLPVSSAHSMHSILWLRVRPRRRDILASCAAVVQVQEEATSTWENRVGNVHQHSQNYVAENL